MMGLPANTRIWIAAGVTDLRRGFTGAIPQTDSELHSNFYLQDTAKTHPTSRRAY